MFFRFRQTPCGLRKSVPTTSLSGITGLLSLVFVCSALVPQQASAQRNKMQDISNALKFEPKQKGVDYETVPAAEIKNCDMVNSKKETGIDGWFILDSSGRKLRMLLDNDGDSQLDQRSYFKNGLEVYREIDTKPKGGSKFSPNQYRWVGQGGSRWGVDENKDGKIDYWKTISPEEVAHEVFESVRTADSKRFACLVVNSDDLRALRLGDKLTKQVQDSARNALTKFATESRRLKSINSKSEWQQFSSGDNIPNLIPKGSMGNAADVTVYNYASSMYKTGDRFGQISLGTMIRVGDAWRVFELPEEIAGNTLVKNGGLHGLPDVTNVIGSDESLTPPPIAKLYSELQELEKTRPAAKTVVAKKALELKVAKKLEQIIAITEGADRATWIENFSDGVVDAYLNDRMDDGVDYLESFMARQKAAKKTLGLDYVAWKLISTRYNERLQGASRRGQADANEKYVKELKQFAKDYPRSHLTADGLFQVGLRAEFDNQFDDAKEYYGLITRAFSSGIKGVSEDKAALVKQFADRAKGSLVRLNAVGKTLPFKGKTLKGQNFDLSSRALRGKIVVVHFYDSEFAYSTQNFGELASLKKKWKSEVILIGASLDNDVRKLQSTLAKQRADWPQLHAPGGVETSPLAMQVGIPILPTVLLIDQDGRLVESNLTVSELDREIQFLDDRYQKKTGAARQARRNK